MGFVVNEWSVPRGEGSRRSADCINRLDRPTDRPKWGGVHACPCHAVRPPTSPSLRRTLPRQRGARPPPSPLLSLSTGPNPSPNHPPFPLQTPTNPDKQPHPQNARTPGAGGGKHDLRHHLPPHERRPLLRLGERGPGAAARGHERRRGREPLEGVRRGEAPQEEEEGDEALQHGCLVWCGCVKGGSACVRLTLPGRSLVPCRRSCLPVPVPCLAVRCDRGDEGQSHRFSPMAVASQGGWGHLLVTTGQSVSIHTHKSRRRTRKDVIRAKKRGSRRGGESPTSTPHTKASEAHWLTNH